MTCSASAPAPADPAAPEPAGLAASVLRALDILAPARGPVAIAVSGGSDSTALLMLARRWANLRGRPLVAATVDHGLRPEAAAEAEAVAGLCRRLDVPHTTLVWRPERGRISQALARAARHRLLAGWARSEGASALALGHTEDDRIETFLIRARAGSSWRGLAGPAPRSASPAWPDGAGLTLIRPLLGCSREALRASLVAAGIGWIDDPSNLADRFERVRMRKLAAHLPPAARASLIRSMNRLADLRAAAAATALRLLNESVRPHGGAACRIDARSLRSLDRSAGLIFLEALTLAAGGSSGPAPSDGLARLYDQIAAPGRLVRGVTLAGAKFVEQGPDIVVSGAPPRRSNPVFAYGFAVDLNAALARAAALLADPGLAALAGARSEHVPNQQIHASARR